MALRTPTAEAEDLKIRWGVAKRDLVNSDERLEVPGLGGDRESRMISRQNLSSVIEPRVEELFSIIQKVIQQSGCEHLLSSGVVLTGGSSLMPGMQELAEDVFARPVRIGVPQYTGSFADIVRNPRFSTVMGLLEDAKKQTIETPPVAPVQSVDTTDFIKSTFKKMKGWFY
jgi:cell division protein FtsA